MEDQDVAQPGRAAALDAEARRFKSSHPDQHLSLAFAPWCWLKALCRTLYVGVSISGHDWREVNIRVERGVRTYHWMRCDHCGTRAVNWSEP